MPEENDAPIEEHPESSEPAFRRNRRLAITGLLVAIDAPTVSDQPWVADGLDISASGMGLILPPELPEGSKVFLTFRLADEIEFSRMPGVVRHREGMSGGVVFEPWPVEERLRLLEYLVFLYETES